MVKITLGIIAGFFAWLIVWVSIEKIFSAIWPTWYGAHQAAFTAAIKGGGQFTADSTILLIHIVCASLVSMMAGCLAAWVARDYKHAPLILGFLLFVLGVLKAVMSWPLVPVWYHILFTALLMPMALVGARLKTVTPP